jgi:hypothetical protein
MLTTTEPFPFMRLPTELRFMAYELLPILLHGKILIVALIKPGMPAAILATSKQNTKKPLAHFDGLSANPSWLHPKNGCAFQDLRG